jgi:hypothetical protein
MKKIIIASLVGAVILFAYQAASWMVSPIHKNSMKYTPKQDTIIGVLQSTLTEDAVFMVPSCPPGTSQAEMEKMQETMIGKPWATIYYHPEMKNNMGKSMALGFLIDLIAVLIVAWILGKGRTIFATFGSRWWLVFCFGIFLLMQSALMQWNWFQAPCNYITGEIVDALLAWALTGLWLAWYMGRKPKNA